MKIENANIAAVNFAEQASNYGTPASGFWRLFFKATGAYLIDDAGTVVGPLTPTNVESLRPFIGRNIFLASPSSPHSVDDEFLTTLNTSTKWTVRSGSAGNAAITANGLRLTGALYMTQPISGSSWEITARLCKQELNTDNALLLVVGNTATSQAVYLGGFYKTGSYPLFYSAIMPIGGGWTSTASTANTNNPTWINFSKMMYHRITLSGGVVTYTMAEDANPESFRNPYGTGTTNTFNLSGIGSAADVVGLYSLGTDPGLVEFFRKTA